MQCFAHHGLCQAYSSCGNWSGFQPVSSIVGGDVGGQVTEWLADQGVHQDPQNTSGECSCVMVFAEYNTNGVCAACSVVMTEMT